MKFQSVFYNTYNLDIKVFCDRRSNIFANWYMATILFNVSRNVIFLKREIQNLDEDCLKFILVCPSAKNFVYDAPTRM